MNEQIRALFPITGHLIYLNHAAVAPPPAPAIAAAKGLLDDLQMNGFLNFSQWLAIREEARQRLAAMMGARPEQVAFMRNTSDALCCIANGLDWKAGDNVVTFRGEFPSNVYAWLNLRAQGVEVRQASERAGRVDLDELLSLIDHRTRVVALSFVQFASGYRADLERIAQVARAHDALLVADIIQGLGALPLDVAAQGVDAAAGACHKWLMTPEGVGYLYLSDRARERVRPTLLGWVSAADPDDMQNQEQQWKPGTLPWETGTFGNTLVYALNESLKMLSEVGVERIAAYLEELTDYLCEGLAGKDYTVVSSRRAGEKSQIVCAEHKDPARWPAMALYKHLQAQGIAVTPRNGRLRISPHLYNLPSDIDALLAALP
jgi:selenocysteine lyase/cysteine desulfurase